MGFYVYYHWDHKPTHALVHRGSCGFCKKGQGFRADKQEGKRGEWSRSFSTYQEARSNAQTFKDKVFDEVKDCSFCKPS